MPNPMAMRWGRLYKGTPAELALEEAIAELGVPYRTQFPGYLYGFRYFPDFLLPTVGLVIEVDDVSHNKLEKMEADAERTAYLEGVRHWRVLRCTNDEALADPRGTVRGLLRRAGMWPLPTGRSLLDSLPRPEKCPRRLKREARSLARRSARAPRHRQNARHTPRTAVQKSPTESQLQVDQQPLA